MMTYNTGNPLGSTNPKDLYDNAQNIDKYVNGSEPFYPDRLNMLRRSWAGMEYDFDNAQAGRETAFQEFLAASAFVFIGDYAAGLNFTNRSQYMIRDGQAYRLAPSTTLPYVTTGNWGTEVSKFTPINSDDVLRQDLSAPAGSALVGYNVGLVGAINRTASDRFRERVSILDFGVVSSAETTQTALIQAAIDATCNVGKALYIPNGMLLNTAGLIINASQGGAIICDGACYLIPAAANTTVLTLTNTTSGLPFLIDGVGFDNNGSFTGCTGLKAADFVGFTWRNVVSKYMGCIAYLQATESGPNAYNATIDNVMQFGKGSFRMEADGAKRIFDVRITNVTQFTTGGDIWEFPWFRIIRGINIYLETIQGQSLNGSTVGVDIQGQCEGVFMNDMIIVWPTAGIQLNLNNGDTVPPSWIYMNNTAVDQHAASGIDIEGYFVRMSNVNVTGGFFRLNSGPGIIVRSGSNDVTMNGTQVNGSNISGLVVQDGATNTRAILSSFTENHRGGTGFDIDIASQNARDPFFRDCMIGTRNIISNLSLINGYGTSRYVFSSRNQQSSVAASSNTILVTYALAPNSLVDGKTLRLTASGVYANNANAKAVSLNVGGVSAGSAGSGQNVSWVIETELMRVDATNVWVVSKNNVGATAACSSVLQNPFNSASSLIISLLVTGVAAGDVVKHHFDIELVD